MAAYIIFIREGKILDPAEMATYQRMNRESSVASDFKIKPLAVYGKMEALEGEAADGVVLLEFPNVAEARRWYDSPGYQAAIAHRKKAATYRALIVEGL